MSSTPPEDQFFGILQFAIKNVALPLLNKLAEQGHLPKDLINEDTVAAGLETLESMDRGEIVLMFIKQRHLWSSMLKCMFTGKRKKENMLWVKNNCHIMIVGLPEAIGELISDNVSKLEIGTHISQDVIDKLIKCSTGFIKRTMDYIERNGTPVGGEYKNAMPMGYDRYEEFVSKPYEIDGVTVDIGYWRTAADIGS